MGAECGCLSGRMCGKEDKIVGVARVVQVLATPNSRISQRLLRACTYSRGPPRLYIVILQKVKAPLTLQRPITWTRTKAPPKPFRGANRLLLNFALPGQGPVQLQFLYAQAELQSLNSPNIFCFFVDYPNSRFLVNDP